MTNTMKSIYKNNGITLIALIITIIVLLILAGIVLSLTIGENGLIKKSQNVGEEYEKAVIKEELETNILDIQVGNYKNITMKDIIEQLITKCNGIQWLDTDSLEPIGEYKGYKFKVKSDYTVEVILKLEEGKTEITIDGATIEPLNNVEILLKCIGYVNNRIDTIEKLIQDTELVKQLIENENSLIYIVRSKEILETIEQISELNELLQQKQKNPPKMTSNSSSILYSSYHNCQPYQAFDQNNSTYWRPTDGEKIQNSYLVYRFSEPRRCYKIKILFGYTVIDGKEFNYIFQGSTDGKNWTNITDELIHKNKGEYQIYTNDINKYLYFRFKGVSGATMHEAGRWSVCINELVYYCI